MDKGQIKLASLLSYVAMVLQIFTSILTTPYIVSKIGDSAYGVYKVIASFVSYMTVLNFGLGTAALRYLSEYRLTSNKKEEQILLGFIHKMNIIISVVVLLLGSLIIILIPTIFGESMSDKEIDLASILFLILLINIISSIFTDKYVAIINAYECFAFVKFLEVIRCLSKIILVFFILFVSRSAITLALIDLGLNIIIMICDKAYCHRKIGIKFSKPMRLVTINWNKYKGFLFYAGGIFITMIINQLLWNVDSVIIGIRRGAIESAIYAVGTTFSSAFFNASIVITNMLLPKVVRMMEGGATEKEYTEFTAKIARIQAYIILYLYVAFIVFGKKFIYLWMGSDYKDAWTTALMVMTGTLFSSFVITVQVILRAQKRQKVYNIVHLFIFSLNAVSTYFAVGKLGINGAALMTLLTYFFGYVFIMYPFYQIKIHINIVSVFVSLFKWCFPVAIVVGTISWILSKNIVNTWMTLFVELVLYTITYFGGMYLVMNSFEKNIVKDAVTGFLHFEMKR